MLCGSLSLIVLILCLAWPGRRSKTVLGTERRSEYSCKIFVLEPPPPYSSLAHSEPPPSYQWAVRKM